MQFYFFNDMASCEALKRTNIAIHGNQAMVKCYFRSYRCKERKITDNRFLFILFMEEKKAFSLDEINFQLTDKRFPFTDSLFIEKRPNIDTKNDLLFFALKFHFILFHFIMRK